jgi:hypothetical protein
MYQNLMALFPKVEFYDYTKVQSRMERFLWGDLPANYHLTWSLAETDANRRMALAVLHSKRSTVAVPFDITAPRSGTMTTEQKLSKSPLPKTLSLREPNGTLHTFPVVDADKHDVRRLDPPGSFSGLRFKIPKKKALKGSSTAQKVDAAHGFVIKTGGSQHPVIPIGGR